MMAKLLLKTSLKLNRKRSLDYFKSLQITIIFKNIISTNYSFARMINEDPRYAMHKNDGKFVVKLSCTTGSSHRKYTRNGADGIRTAIKQFMNNPRVYGYYLTAIIQPCVRENTEAKVVCQKGKAVFMNPHSRKRKSAFRNLPEREFKDFAEMVLMRIKEAAPQVIWDQLLRVDIFGVRDQHDELHLFVNEIEGYEAAAWSKGINNHTGTMIQFLSEAWYDIVDTLIECHMERIKVK